MTHKRMKLLGLGAALAALLYVVAYVLLLDPTGFTYLTSPPISVMEERYRVGGSTAEKLFVPANWVDRLLRPSYWVQRHGPSPEEIDAEAESLQNFEF